MRIFTNSKFDSASLSNYFFFFFFLQIESNVSKIFKNWKIKTIIFFHAN